MNRQITVIAPIIAHYDAISAAAVVDFQLLRAEPGWNVDLLTSHNELDVPARIVGGLVGLLSDDAFRNADILIYHFGIYHPFIDALLVGNGHARQIVVFHNITPRDVVPLSDRPTIDKSLRQAHNLRRADEIWAVSTVNAEALKHFGVNPNLVFVIPLAVSRPKLSRLRDKLGEDLRFLFVGRLVAAKGIRDLIEAFAQARTAIPAPFRVSIAGNAAFSSQDFIAECKSRIVDASLRDCVEVIESPGDETLVALYERAHVLCIPSFHEGFCVPVVEGLRAGCIPVGYAAGNVPNVANGLGRLVESGDIPALSDALIDVSRGLIEASRDPDAKCLRLDRGVVTVDDFDRGARAHAETFNFDRLAAIKIARIRRLLPLMELRASPTPIVTAVPTGSSRGRIVALLNRLTRTSEPVKRLLRPGFVRAVDIGARIPGMRRTTALVRSRIPGPYQWFAERYDAFRTPHESDGNSPAPAMITTPRRHEPQRTSIAPPEDLSADERNCFARVVFAMNASQKRISW